MPEKWHRRGTVTNMQKSKRRQFTPFRRATGCGGQEGYKGNAGNTGQARKGGEMGLHVFVAMPYGRKHDIDFDAVFADCLKPALESAGYQVFRTDERRSRREIDAGIIQPLLQSDLVVVDQTLDSTDVWYELDVLNA